MNQKASKLPGSKLARPVSNSKPQNAFEKSARGAGVAKKTIDQFEDSVLEKLPAPELSRSSSVNYDIIIGDRVVTPKGKGGKVVYIGYTKFATGTWCGIVLDEPLGNHDGLCQGVRYFQCEPNRGTFIRIEKLTKFVSSDQQMNDAGDAELSYNEIPQTTTIDLDYTINDRVIVSGTKHGIVRYIGETRFAPDLWIGVELDEALGKNDGSVAGERYFSCKPKFGLFAKSDNVMKAPPIQSRKVPITPSGRKMSRDISGSMESVSSIGSSVCSSASRSRPKQSSSKTTVSSITTLQKALKEKEQHVGQLLTERDMDRSEIAVAYNKQEQMECEIETLKKERNQFLGDIDKLKISVNKLEEEKSKVLYQLEDEKRKVEELEFDKEEGNIEKEILQTKKQDEDKRIKELNDEKEAVSKRLNNILKQNLVTEKETNSLIEALKLENVNLKQSLENLEIEFNNMRSKTDISLNDNDKTKFEIPINFKEFLLNSEIGNPEIEKFRHDIRDYVDEKVDKERRSKISLEEKIGNLEETIKDLLSSKTNMQLQINSQKNLAEETIKKAEVQFESLCQDKTEREAEVRTLKAEKENLVEKLLNFENSYKTAVVDTDEKFNNLNKSLEEKRLNESSLKNKIAQLEAEIEKDCRIKSNLEKQLVESKETEKKSCLEKEEVINELRLHIDQQEEKYNRLQSRYTNMESHLNELMKSNAVNAHSNEQYESTVNDLKSELNELKIKLSSIASEKQEREIEVGTLRNVIEELKKNADVETTSKVNETREIERRKKEELEISLDTLKREANLQIKNLTNEKDQLESDLFEKNEQIVILQKQYTDNVESFDIRLSSEKQLLQNKITEICKQIDILSTENLRLKSDRDLYFEIKEDNGQKLRQLKLDFDTLQQENGKINKQYDILLEKTNNLEKISSNLNQDGNDNSTYELRGELDFQQTIIGEQQKKINELERKIRILSVGDESDTDSISKEPKTIIKRTRLYCDICEAFDLHDTEDCNLNDSETF